MRIRVPALAGALALAILAGGCSYQLDSMLPRSKAVGHEDITGSLRRSASVRPVGEPAEADLAIARAAAAELLAKGDTDASLPWENPATGARGTITPIASAYSMDGLTCRDFLASYVRGPSESWLQGEACERGRGKWEVRHMRPWRRG